MASPAKHLEPGEVLVVDLHPHWWFFAEPTGAIIAAIVLRVIGWRMAEGWFEDVVSFIGSIGLIVSGIWLLSRYLMWVTTHFVVTNQRVAYQRGVIAKQGVEIPMFRVNNVNFNQTIFERVVGAGDLLIESGGEEGQSTYTDIRRPDRIQQLIRSQVQGSARAATATSAAPGAPSPVDVAGQLERLEAMMQRGTITAEEFEIQKRRLLG